MTPTDEAITKLTSGIELAIKQIGALGEKYGPEVIDAALWVVRLTGIGNVVLNLAVFLVAGTVLTICGRNIWREWARVKAEKGAARVDIEDTNAGIVIPNFLFVVIGGAVGGIFLFRVLNIWDYVAIIEPKLWVAKRLLNL